MEVQKKIERSLAQIITYIPALSIVISGWEQIRPTQEVPTFATNGKELAYNPEFAETLHQNEITGILLHEIFHCVFLHPSEITYIQAKGKIKPLWEVALEIVCNAAVKDTIKMGESSWTLPGKPFSPFKENLLSKIPKGDIYFYDECGHHESAIEIYKKLEEQYGKQLQDEFEKSLMDMLNSCERLGQCPHNSGTSQSSANQQNQPNSKSGSSSCSHEETSSEKQPDSGDTNKTTSESTQNSNSTNNNPENTTTSKDKCQNCPHRKIMATVGDIIESKDRDVSREMVARAIATLEQLQKQKGHLPVGIVRFLEKLRKSRVPWNKILHNFMARVIAGLEDYSWQKPNWRHPLSEKVIVPGMIKREKRDVVIVIDTSGSVTTKELTDFASEIAKLSTYVKEFTVITCDAKVHEKVKVRNIREFLTKIKLKGGGGTDFRPIFSEVKNCMAMIFFTDGMGTYPEKKPHYPVLWILTKEHSKPPFGKIAYIFTE